jgi:hypothetical protein
MVTMLLQRTLFFRTSSMLHIRPTHKLYPSTPTPPNRPTTWLNKSTLSLETSPSSEITVDSSAGTPQHRPTDDYEFILMAQELIASERSFPVPSHSTSDDDPLISTEEILYSYAILVTEFDALSLLDDSCIPRDSPMDTSSLSDGTLTPGSEDGSSTAHGSPVESSLSPNNVDQLSVDITPSLYMTSDSCSLAQVDCSLLEYLSVTPFGASASLTLLNLYIHYYPFLKSYLICAHFLMVRYIEFLVVYLIVSFSISRLFRLSLLAVLFILLVPLFLL